MFSPNKRADTINGILFVSLFALAAIQISQWSWIKHAGISPLIVGILLGILYANTLHHRLPEEWLPGISFSARKILRLAVILYGFYISIQEVLAIGWAGAGTAAIMMSSTLLLAYWLGVYLLGMDKQTALLTGAGSAICGAAAILAFEPVIKAKGHQTAAAVATVVLFGTISMLLYPMLFDLGILNLSSSGWGIYIGATVHEVAQVVGAASDIGQTVCDDAVIVKMTRVMLIVPTLLLVGWWWARQQIIETSNKRAPLTIPWFALGFLGVVLFNSLHLLPASRVEQLQQVDQFLLTMAMTALGMETSVKKLKGVGIKPFVLAALLFIWLIGGGYTVTYLLTWR
ncbi:YeiH family protein [Mariprofundus ferrooxydans]|uniref:YeiH family protein n=1 Tax=Mariprofundus ferrooxydans TaxID=314344 RepID=UPI001430A719|nr:YeiH family protein [Mariprofundus ferrooxydans]